MNRDGSDAHFVTAGTTPSFSPDSRHLAIGGAATTTIGVVGTSISTWSTSTAAVGGTSHSMQIAFQSRAVADGTRIAFGSFRAPFPPYGYPVVQIVGADGRNERSRGTGELAALVAGRYEIAYADDSDANVPTTIRVFKVEGDTYSCRVGPRGRLFDAISPAWSLTGGQLTFLLGHYRLPERGGLAWRIDANGRGRHPIASGCIFGTGSADRIRGSLAC